MQVYLVDEAGYLSDSFPAQKNRKRPGTYLLPPDAILTAPETKDGYWPKWNKEVETWDYEKIPTCIEDFLELEPISHQSQTPRDIKYRELIDKFKDDNEQILLKRGETDLSWYVERKPDPTPEEIAKQELQQAKAERAAAVNDITVEVDGMLFDGDEEAQTRLSRTISAALALGVDIETERRTWVLADNTVAQPTIAQMVRALKLAGDKQTELWTVPYEDETTEETTE